jgi:hypothetical protein
MLQVNPPTDPIVAILRLAYRRGLAIQQERARSQTGNPAFSQVDEPLDERPAEIQEAMSHGNQIIE